MPFAERLSVNVTDERRRFSKIGRVAEDVRLAIPPSIRAFVGSLAGDRSPITEDYLSPEDIERLRAVVENAEINAKTEPDRKGGRSIQYSDYRFRFPADYKGEPDELRPTAYAANKKANPSLGFWPERVLNMLGRANYTKNPDGSTTITDNYDFQNAEFDARWNEFTPLQKVGMGIINPTRTIGQVFLHDIERPVRITIPHKKR
jgi:hypothetical protein